MQTPTRGELERRLLRFDTREAWLAQRRQGLGCSELAAIAGRDSYKTAFGVWAEKHADPDAADDAPNSDERAWGTDSEHAILSHYGRRHPELHVVAYQHAILPHPKEPWLFGTPDAIAYESDSSSARVVRIIDAKRDNSPLAEYGEPGTDHVPQRMVFQGAGLCEVVDVAPECTFAVTRFGRPPLEWPVHRDPELAELLLDFGRSWHKRFLEGDERPEVDGSEGCKRYLQRRQREQGRPVLLKPTARLVSLLLRRQTAALLAERNQGDVELAQQELVALLEGAEGAEGLFTYKRTRDNVGVDFEQAYLRLLAEYAGRTTPAEAVELDRALRAEAVKVLRAGSFRFLPKITSTETLGALLSSLEPEPSAQGEAVGA